MNGCSGTVSGRRASVAEEDRELLIAREAIAMVACGASPRVVVAGIRHGEQILVSARRFALESGVRVNRLPVADGSRTDLVVEPIHE